MWKQEYTCTDMSRICCTNSSEEERRLRNTKIQKKQLFGVNHSATVILNFLVYKINEQSILILLLPLDTFRSGEQI